MNRLTIEIDSTLLAEVTSLAERNHVSIEEQAAHLLRKSLRVSSTDVRVRIAEAIAAMTPVGVQQTNSTDLIRQDRDR